MVEFPLNPQRFDPYQNFKFRVKWDGGYVAGVSRVSPFIRRTEVVVHREGGDPSTSRKSPGLSEYAAITLERGVTQDVEFEARANKVWNFGAGQLVLAYKIFRCWVSEYQALPELDANDAQVAIQLIVLQNEGWERDTAVVEPPGTVV